jgi:HEPN domain-containing protein
MRARKSPNYDLCCFCAQQCGEKYLKALLQECGQPTPRTHDLPKLLDLLVGDYPELDLLRPQLQALTAFAVEFRYPGGSATKALARQACRDSALIRDSLRRLLRLPARTTDRTHPGKRHRAG